MPIVKFLDVRKSSPEGILACGGDLHPESLLLAYQSGIFPWPMQVTDHSFELFWFCPPQRAILDFNDLHLPRSLKRFYHRTLKQKRMRFTHNRAFEEVIHACAQIPRSKQHGTWITPKIIESYTLLHQLGFAHSFEAWDTQDHLIGGIYGVAIAGTFSAESMFYKLPNASKLCLLQLIDHLKTRGLDWMDIQMLTPHLKALGAKEISRENFLERLKQTQARKLQLFD